eukprot:321471_1
MSMFLVLLLFLTVTNTNSYQDDAQKAILNRLIDAYEDINGDYDDYNYYENNEDYDEIETYYDESEFDDEWIDTNTGEKWVVLSAMNGLNDEIISDNEWNNDELWDLMTKENTNKGFKIEKKCMNVFGRQLCLCQFIDWLESGTIKKQCGPKYEHKIAGAPKDKPKWMPHHFWKYLHNHENPHKTPTDIDRKKYNLYLKFKNKGY